MMLQAPKCPTPVLLVYTLFSNISCPFSKIAYTRQAPMMPDSSPSLVYATVQKPLHHLEKKRMHAMRLQASKYLFSVLYAYTLL